MPSSTHNQPVAAHARGIAPLAPTRPVRVDVPAEQPPRPSGRTRAVVELSKPGITRLVTITAVVGFVLQGAVHRTSLSALVAGLIGTIVGTALSSGGANAINQYIERRRDALMHRTARRPIIQRRISPRGALLAGVGLSLAGVGVLWGLGGPASACVSLGTILFYVLIYTPSKPLTPLNTLLGAVPGALPPLIGWCAAAHGAGQSDWGALGAAGGWALFALMFVWQIPHFLALAWMYREDYARGGFRMLPIIDDSGTLTAGMMLAWSIALVPATLLPVLAMPGTLGWTSGLVAGVMGVIFVAMVCRFVRTRAHAQARGVFLASIAHLPLLSLVIVSEAIVRAYLLH